MAIARVERDFLVTFQQLLATLPWKAIPNCPGRFALPASDVTPAQLIGLDAPLRECRMPSARDLVVVAPLVDGGLISYRRTTGEYLHTLNTPEGFHRKLRQLGLPGRLEGSE